MRVNNLFLFWKNGSTLKHDKIFKSARRWDFVAGGGVRRCTGRLFWKSNPCYKTNFDRRTKKYLDRRTNYAHFCWCFSMLFQHFQRLTWKTSYVSILSFIRHFRNTFLIFHEPCPRSLTRSSVTTDVIFLQRWTWNGGCPIPRGENVCRKLKWRLQSIKILNAHIGGELRTDSPPGRSCRSFSRLNLKLFFLQSAPLQSPGNVCDVELATQDVCVTCRANVSAITSQRTQPLWFELSRPWSVSYGG